MHVFWERKNLCDSKFVQLLLDKGVNAKTSKTSKTSKRFSWPQTKKTKNLQDLQDLKNLKIQRDPIFFLKIQSLHKRQLQKKQ